MKKIHFESISIKNFLSIGDDPIEINFSEGLNLITGENKDNKTRNGVGKTSIVESIYWCLFGNTIRDIKTEKIIHNYQKKKTCEITLKVKITDSSNKTSLYTIKRTAGPSKVEILCDDENITLSTIPKNDEYIKKLIGANEEVFQNAVIMTANNTLPFMAQKKIDKRKFIEGILNIGIFGEMLLKVRSDYNEKKKENDLLAKDFSSEQRILEFLTESEENFDSNKQERIEVIEEKIKNIERDLKNLNDKDIEDVSFIKKSIRTKEEEIETLTEELKNINNNAVSLGELKSNVFNEINQAKKDKQKILDKGNTCPTCNREYCEDDLEYIKKELAKLDKIINNNTPLCEKYKKESDENTDLGSGLTTKISILKKDIRNLTEKISDSSLHEQKIKSLNEKKEEFKDSINEIKKETFKDGKRILNSKDNIKKLEEQIDSVQKDLLILENSKFVVSEEGVKTFIVKKMLSVLNSQLNFYLKTLNAPCTCVFDETFEETIKNIEGKECSYFNFSGGERKRIDIAILFMFQDILRLQTGVSFNLSMYDELLDSAVDQNGITKIMEILNERKENNKECIYIVSHNKNATNFIFDNVLILEKSNGKTVLVS